MRLRVKNIGILSDSEIEIAGITVVAGENNTGKSTFGKALYAIFNALNRLEYRVDLAKRRSTVDLIKGMLARGMTYDLEKWNHQSTKKLMNNKLTEELISEIASACPQQNINEKEIFIKKAEEILRMDEDLIKKKIILSSLKGEFRGQIKNQLKINEKSQISLIVKDETTSVEIDDESAIYAKGLRNLEHTPVYIDDISSIFGNARLPNELFQFVFNHRHNINMMDLLNSKIGNGAADAEEDIKVIWEILYDQQLEPVLKRLKEICHGSLILVDGEIKFVDEMMSGVKLNLANISSGLKTFLILQQLIRSGTICENGTVIMDEPEIHLHPKWQVVLAELIVMLQKVMSLHILVTTHSPYFISAIDVFSKKHKVIGNNRYYFNSRNGNDVKVEDVTKSIYVIYDSLAGPYQTIQDEAMACQA